MLGDIEPNDALHFAVVREPGEHKYKRFSGVLRNVRRNTFNPGRLNTTEQNGSYVKRKQANGVN